MSSSVLPFLLSLHFMPRPIVFASVSATSTFDFCALLSQWASTHSGPLQVLSSTQPAAIEAAMAVYESKKAENAKYREAFPALGPPVHFVELLPSNPGRDGESIDGLDDRRDGESYRDLVRTLRR